MRVGVVEVSFPLVSKIVVDDHTQRLEVGGGGDENSGMVASSLMSLIN